MTRPLPSIVEDELLRYGYQLPSRTRAGRYRLIDRLIEDGFLTNSLRPGQEWYNVYALQITAAGEAELA